MSEPEQEPPRVPVYQGTLVLRKQGKDTSRYFILCEDTLEYFKSHDESLTPGVAPRGCLVHGDFHTIQLTDDGINFSHQDDWGVHLIAPEGGDIRPWLDVFARLLPATHDEGENGMWTQRDEAADAEESAEPEFPPPEFPAKPKPLCLGWAQVEKKHGVLARRYFELTDWYLNYYECDKDLENMTPPRGVIQFHDVVGFRAAQLKFYMTLEELKKPVVLQVDSQSDFDMWAAAFGKVLEAKLGDKFVLEHEAEAQEEEEATSDDLLCQSTFDLEVEGRTETKLVRLFEDRLEYAPWSKEGDGRAAVEKSIPAESINDIEIEDDGLVLEVEGLGSVALRVSKQAPGGKATDLGEWVTAFRKVCRSESPSPARPSPEHREPPGKPASDKALETPAPMELPAGPERREAPLLDDSVEALCQGLVSMSDSGSARAPHCVTMCRDRFLYFSKQGDASSGAQLKQVLASDVRKIVVLDDGFQVVLDDRTLEFHDLKRSEMEEWALSFRGIASWKAQQPPVSSSEDRDAADAEQSSVQVTTSGTALADAWASKMTPNQRHPHSERSSERRVSFDETERPRSHSPRPKFFVPRCGRISPPERYRSPEPRKRTSYFTARSRRRLEGHRAKDDPFVINTCRSGPQPTKLLHGSEQSFITTGRQCHDDENLLVKPYERDPELPLPPSKHAVSCLAAKITGDTPRSCTGRAGGFTWTKITTSEDNGASARCTPRQPGGGFSITGKVNEANRSMAVKKDGLVGKITDPGRAAGSFRRVTSQPIPGKITDAARETQGWVKHASRADSVRKYKDMAAKTYTRNKLSH